MDLPRFKYHPDPVATGSVAASDAECPCCQKARGFAYTGPVYSTEEIDGLCPWCIADASAHERYKCEFVDAAGIGGYEAWDAVPEPVIEEVAYRMPGFSGWQQERWWTHCGDAAEFLGPVGREEALRAGNQFLTAIRTDARLDEGPQWTEYLQALQRDRGPTAYLFRCRHCGQLGGYSDIH